MYLNGFSVKIIPGREDGGYVEMIHRTHYRIRLRNFNQEPCDARVEIQGEHIGTWRVPGEDAITIDRPSNVAKLFTFYAANTSGYRRATNLPEGDSRQGLITVVFTPEKKRPQIVNTYASHYSPSAGSEEMHTSGLQSFRGAQSLTPKSVKTGTTGLSGKSNQTFGIAERIVYDFSRRTTIHLRLVSDDRDEPYPISINSSPIPPLV